MKRLLLIVLATSMVIAAEAQPAKRRVTTSNAAAQARNGNTPQTGTDRASLMFPTSDAMPEDVVWRRDVYRQLDLNLDKNAPLYYPVEPIGNQCNLFTYLFRLFLTGRVNAYTYKLDGNESFQEKDKISAKDMLDRYYIYYEENNGKFTVADNDVPSAEVTRYYIKESSYFDQRTGTYKSKVTALCPVLMRGDDFGGDGANATPYPLFWMKYDDLAPFLSKLPVMSSNLNNVTNMTADDFFTMNRYDGKIYKTNNMQGKVLANYCKTDSDMVREQKKIEKQLSDFEEHIWHAPEPTDTTSTDSTEAEAKIEKKSTKATTTAKTSKVASSTSGTSRRSSQSNGSSTKKEKQSSAKVAPQASVRRERR